MRTNSLATAALVRKRHKLLFAQEAAAAVPVRKPGRSAKMTKEMSARARAPETTRASVWAG